MLKIYCGTHCHEIAADTTATLAELIPRAGIAVKSHCGKGICTRCTVLLLSGRFRVENDIVSIEDGEQLPVPACRTWPLSSEAVIAIPADH